MAREKIQKEIGIKLYWERMIVKRPEAKYGGPSLFIKP